MISIDPGAHYFAYARWDKNELADAGRMTFMTYWCAVELLHNMLSFDSENIKVVCEWPQVYQRVKSKADPEDLLVLAATVGALGTVVERAEQFVLYRPREWKGNIPKEIHHPRILKACPEAKQFLPKNKKHAADILDAVGIGLYHLSRTK